MPKKFTLKSLTVKTVNIAKPLGKIAAGHSPADSARCINFAALRFCALALNSK